MQNRFVLFKKKVIFLKFWMSVVTLVTSKKGSERPYFKSLKSTVFPKYKTKKKINYRECTIQILIWNYFHYFNIVSFSITYFYLTQYFQNLSFVNAQPRNDFDNSCHLPSFFYKRKCNERKFILNKNEYEMVYWFLVYYNIMMMCKLQQTLQRVLFVNDRRM